MAANVNLVTHELLDISSLCGHEIIDFTGLQPVKKRGFACIVQACTCTSGTYAQITAYHKLLTHDQNAGVLAVESEAGQQRPEPLEHVFVAALRHAVDGDRGKRPWWVTRASRHRHRHLHRRTAALVAPLLSGAIHAHHFQFHLDAGQPARMLIQAGSGLHLPALLPLTAVPAQRPLPMQNISIFHAYARQVNLRTFV